MQNQNNWYKSFFNGLAVELWDNAVPRSYSDEEAKFITLILPGRKKLRILDAPCGSGRIATRLSAMGHHVTGIDISEISINKLKKESLKRKFDIEAIRADILNYDTNADYDLAVCMGNSFGYFPEDKMKIFTGNIFNSLKKRGRFLINTGILAESILPNLEEKNWYEMSGIFFLIENFYQAGESVLKTDMIFIKGNNIERKTAYQFVFTLDSVIRMLSFAGFNSVKVYSGLKGEQYKAGDAQAYIVAGK